jgi:hypothetical protein
MALLPSAPIATECPIKENPVLSLKINFSPCCPVGMAGFVISNEFELVQLPVEFARYRGPLTQLLMGMRLKLVADLLTKIQGAPPNRTVSTWLKFLPVILIKQPIGPLFGVNDMISGV